jgi:hypothetical protein
MRAGPWSSRPSHSDQGDCRNSNREAQSVSVCSAHSGHAVLTDSRVRVVDGAAALGATAHRLAEAVREDVGDEPAAVPALRANLEDASDALGDAVPDVWCSKRVPNGPRRSLETA